MIQDFIQNGSECLVFHWPEGVTEGDKGEESSPTAISGKQPPPGKYDNSNLTLADCIDL